MADTEEPFEHHLLGEESDAVSTNKTKRRDANGLSGDQLEF